MYLRTRSCVVRYCLASPDTVWRRQMVGAHVGEPTELVMARLDRSTGTSSLTGGSSRCDWLHPEQHEEIKGGDEFVERVLALEGDGHNFVEGVEYRLAAAMLRGEDSRLIIEAGEP